MAKEHIEVFSLAARTATPTDANVTIPNSCGVFVINVTAATATPSVVFAVNGVDSLGNEYNIITSAAITGTGTTVLRVFPGATASANVTVNDMLMTDAINVSATHGDADSITYSVEFHGAL